MFALRFIWLSVLLTACAKDPDPSIIDPRFDDLRNTSSKPLDADLDADGNIAVLSGEFTALTGGDALDEVTAFVGLWEDLLTVDAAQLDPIEVKDGGADSSVAHFGIQHSGLPVFDAFVVGEVSRPFGVTTLITHVPADLEVGGNDPLVSMEAAESTAAALEHEDFEDTTVLADPVLGIFNGGLYLDQPTPSQLAWQISLFDGDVWIDAKAGDVIWVDPSNHDLDLELFTANNSSSKAAVVGWHEGTTPTRVQWFDEAGVVGGAAPSEVGERAHRDILTTASFYENNFGYFGIDGADVFPLRIYVHYKEAGYRNASFNRTLQSLWFGDGATYLDVMAHEFTHGVIYNTSGLRYQAFSGALNESLADSFGAFIDEGDKWKIGEQLARGPLRYMNRPGRRGHPDHWDDRRTIPWRGTCRSGPTRCRGERTCVAGKCADLSDDKGHVHRNSGIPNKATWLMAAEPVGRVRGFKGVKVRSIGQHKASHIMMDVMQLYLRETSHFGHYARAMVGACKRSVRAGEFGLNEAGVETKDCGAILNAMHAVGIHKGPDKDEDTYIDDVDRCPDDYDPDQDDSDFDGLGDVCDDLDGANITVVTRHSHPNDGDPVHIVIDDEPMSERDNRVRSGSSRVRNVVANREFTASLGRGGVVWDTTDCGFAMEGGVYEAVYHPGFGLDSSAITCWRVGPGVRPQSPLDPGTPDDGG